MTGHISGPRASRTGGKVLSCLLVVLIALAFASLTLAIETDDASAAWDASGYQFSTSYWTYDGSKLTISGGGAMDHDKTPEWKHDARWKEVTEIEVTDGITSICNYAFCNAPNLTTVTFDVQEHGTAPEKQTAIYDSSAIRPADPVRYIDRRRS